MSTEKSDAALEIDATLASKEIANKQVAHQPTVGQMERAISQKIQALYKRALGHQLGRVTCQLFDAKVVIVLENSISQPVKLLLEESRIELAERVCHDINSAMQPQIKELLANVLGVKVLDVLSDTALSIGSTGITGVLASLPPVRNPEAIHKTVEHTQLGVVVHKGGVSEAT